MTLEITDLRNKNKFEAPAAAHPELTKISKQHYIILVHDCHHFSAVDHVNSVILSGTTWPPAYKLPSYDPVLIKFKLTEVRLMGI